MANSEVHPVAASYDTVAEQYSAGRPDYPDELVDQLRALHDFTSQTQVVELGAGTGKLTAQLARTGATITAIEPSTEMLAVLQRDAPNVFAVLGRAEEIPKAANSVDVVVSGEAFHWFDAALVWKELTRVVKPGGLVYTAWLHRNVSTWQEQINELLRPLVRTIPPTDQRDSPSLSGFPSDEFTEPVHNHLVYTVPYTLQRLRTMYSSYSYIAALDPQEQAKKLDQIDGIVRDGLGVGDADVFDLPLTLQSWWTKRL